MRVLIVEDDPGIAEPLAHALEREGLQVASVRTGAEALAAAEPDVVLLDLRLPDMDGRAVLGAVRARSRVPVIVISACAGEDDRVLALRSGADDYVVKPFGVREVLARVRAVARRAEEEPWRAPLTAGSLEVDIRARRARLGGRDLDLTRAEFDLLSALLRARGAVLAPRALGPPNLRAVQYHVASLRRKLGDPRWIETVRGVGVRLRAPGR